MSTGKRSQRRELPSMSVKRKVTIPVGASMVRGEGKSELTDFQSEDETQP